MDCSQAKSASIIAGVTPSVSARRERFVPIDGSGGRLDLGSFLQGVEPKRRPTGMRSDAHPRGTNAYEKMTIDGWPE